MNFCLHLFWLFESPQSYHHLTMKNSIPYLSFNFILCLFLCATSAASDEFATVPEHNSSFFEEIKSPWIVKPYLELPTYSLYLGPPDIKGYALVPNFAVRFGAVVGWRQSSVTAAFSLPIPQEELDRRGDSEQENIAIHANWFGWNFDLYSQSYKGLYAGNPINEVSLNKASRYTQFPDASVRSIGLNIYYVFQNAQYDISSAFDQVKIPILDGGSWFLMPFVNHLELDMGSKVVPGTEVDAITTRPEVNHLKLTSLGGTLGYGRTWLLERSESYFSIQSAIGPAIQIQSRAAANSPAESSTGLSGKWNFRVSWAKNNQQHTWGLKIFTDTLYSRLGELDIYSTVMTGQIFYGWRF